jgi:hypothetical protein
LKAIFIVLVLAACACDIPKAPLEHNGVAEWNEPRRSMSCWTQTVCNVPCVVCSAGHGLAMSCDHAKGKMRCGVIFPNPTP